MGSRASRIRSRHGLRSRADPGGRTGQFGGVTGGGADLPDGEDTLERPGQGGGAVRAADVGLVEAEPERAWTAPGTEAQRAYRERAPDDRVPAVGEQDRDYSGGRYRGAAHTAALLSSDL